MAPNGNRIVVYKGPGQVTVETSPAPEIELVQVVGGMFYRDGRRALAHRRRRELDRAAASLRF